jgi:DNA-binding transcriptional MerR regulator
VCELADVEAYVLRSWEAEFPDLGVAKTPAGPRLYRRADVERVLRIKELVYVDGLTLAGARRQLSHEGLSAPARDSVSDADVAALMNDAVRQELLNVRRGLSWIAGVLSGNGVTAEDRVLTAPRSAAPAKGAIRDVRKVPAPAVKGRSHKAVKPPKRVGRSKKR